MIYNKDCTINQTKRISPPSKTHVSYNNYSDICTGMLNSIDLDFCNPATSQNLPFPEDNRQKIPVTDNFAQNDKNTVFYDKTPQKEKPRLYNQFLVNKKQKETPCYENLEGWNI